MLTILPNLLIIGAAKCGTTSLHYYLDQHPQICMSRTKELHYFVKEKNLHKGIDWYKSQFAGEGDIFGETSPTYSKHPAFAGVPERIYSVIPHVKIIYLIRDPVERLISGYVHVYSEGREERSIENVILGSFRNYIITSKYYMQLAEYLKYFPLDNILIITSEELKQNRIETLSKIFSFLGVDPNYYSPKFENTMNEGSERRRKNNIGAILKKLSETSLSMKFPENFRTKVGRILYFPFSKRVERPHLDTNLRNILIETFRDDVEKLRKCTGLEFKNWCV